MTTPFTRLAAIVLLVVAAVHAYRLYTGAISVVVEGYAIPLWVSWPAVVISLFLSVMLFREARR